MFAGPNGAGKSTLVRKYGVAARIPVVNPDDIKVARDISAQDAGRLALMERVSLLQSCVSFAVETTLTGQSELLLLKKAKATGYKLNLVYVGIDDADQSNSRVLTRVARGGHDVLELDIYRRYNRSLQNLPKAMALCDRVRILDNAGADYRYVLSLDNHKVRFVSKQPPQWLKVAVSPALLKRNEQDLSR
jgi:predicted ABC-type ATPase